MFGDSKNHAGQYTVPVDCCADHDEPVGGTIHASALGTSTHRSNPVQIMGCRAHDHVAMPVA